MYVLILVVCMSYSEKTHCQSFPREASFASQSQCHRAAAMEKGIYLARIRQRRSWHSYKWHCRPNTGGLSIFHE